MVKMGIKRKDMHEGESMSPTSEKDYEKEVVRPELHLSGEHAKMMGAEDLKSGDRVRQTVEWVVKDHVKREVDGEEPTYDMTLCLDKGSDCVECGGEKNKEEDSEEPDDSAEGAGLEYITGGKAEAE